jgi:hypothetical protein
MSLEIFFSSEFTRKMLLIVFLRNARNAAKSVIAHPSDHREIDSQNCLSREFIDLNS